MSLREARPCSLDEKRWSWVEIDLSALRHNTKQFVQLLPRRTQLMAVLKADAYGHGALGCAKALLSAGATQFGVATVEEGVKLRKESLSCPILLLSEPPLSSIPELVEYDLMPSVATSEFGLAFGEAAAAAGKVGNYHLIIDTGMTRCGVPYNHALELREMLDFHRGLACAGTFTHFATADAFDDWDFALQLNRFNETVIAIHERGYELGLVHCDNTPGTVLHPQCHYDMVRVGLGLYGYHPTPATERYVDLRPVMSVRARVTRELFPSVGDGVGYGATYRVPKQNIQIATIPLGYADGLSREFSGRIDVLVGGQRHPQVGRICMDQCMFAVDVNNVRRYCPTKAVQVGDLVTIMGRDGDEMITADELAELRNTISYEVLCDFGMRLTKVYC